MGIEFIEDLIPEYTIIILTIITLCLCIYSAFKTRDLPATGYIIPLVYILGIYFYFAIGSPPAVEREFFARLGFIMLILDIGIWRLVELIANSKREISRGGNKQTSISFKEIKNFFLNLRRKEK